jgi:hypothetical protein
VDKKGNDAGVLRFAVAGHGLFGSSGTHGHHGHHAATTGVAAGGMAAGVGAAGLAGSLPFLHLVTVSLTRHDKLV